MTTWAQRARAGEVMIGTFLNLGSALAAEVCAIAGFDWLLVDLEHGAGGEEALLGQLLAGAAHGVPVVVRAESPERIRIGHVLDLGAKGVMVPRLDSPDEVHAALGHLRYPPRGDRGIAAYLRGRRFGQDPRTLSEIDDDVVSLIQIESTSALEQVEAIAAIEGLDVLFVGPSDLSHSMGIGGQFGAPAFLEALDRVVAASRQAGVAAGIFVGDPDQVPTYLERGFTFLAASSDSALLMLGAHRALAARGR